MKVFLMHPDRDFDVQQKLPPNEEALTQDLELSTLFEAMALDDKFLFDVAKKAVLSSLSAPDAIHYRQQVLADCLNQPAVVRELYTIAVEAIEGERKGFWSLYRGASPDTILYRSVQVLELFVELLKRLRRIAGGHAGAFRSNGFVRFFAMLATELDDEYFQSVDAHLQTLKFRGGTVISAALGKGNKGTRYVLRRPRETPSSWLQWLAIRNRRSAYSFEIADRDEAGARALADLRGQGINLVANALAQSTDHILSFFRMLRAELAFHIGCLNLHEQLAKKGEPTCFPVPEPAGRLALSVQGLYDVCLTLHLETRVVGNDMDADGKRLVMITGANQGGKSTFLRGVGLAQLMMQCGMFAPAERLRAEVRDGVFTHYKREEDTAMESGKLAEELGRMSTIVDVIRPNSLLLCNESFASTNEREGSEIARQVVRALLEAGVKVLFVTHLFDLAQRLSREQKASVLFLRAERQDDGRRTFRLIEGAPLPTSFGQDLYGRIFGVS
jgi:DNA mismatch repair ATPase MutS